MKGKIKVITFYTPFVLRLPSCHIDGNKITLFDRFSWRLEYSHIFYAFTVALMVTGTHQKPSGHTGPKRYFQSTGLHGNKTGIKTVCLLRVFSLVFIFTRCLRINRFMDKSEFITIVKKKKTTEAVNFL